MLNFEFLVILLVNYLIIIFNNLLLWNNLLETITAECILPQKIFEIFFPLKNSTGEGISLEIVSPNPSLTILFFFNI